MKKVFLIVGGIFLAVAVLLAGGLYWLVDERSNEYFAPSSSMAPTIPAGATVDTEPVDAGDELERGSVVVISVSRTDGPTELIKRVVGLPGDELSANDGLLYLNGEPVDEPYLAPRTLTRSVDTTVVPEGMVYLLGDNRENSEDSRTLGVLPRTDIVARAKSVDNNNDAQL